MYTYRYVCVYIYACVYMCVHIYTHIQINKIDGRMGVGEGKFQTSKAGQQAGHFARTMLES